MEAGKSQDTITGSGSQPILAGYDTSNMAAPSEPARTSIASSSTMSDADRQIINLLSLLQTDYFDLQSNSVSVFLDGSEGGLGAILSWPGHSLGFENGQITVDGTPVVSL